jgi:hypothetical protein
MRRSILRPWWETDNRPSCGTLRSAMFISAMIFSRDVTPFWMFFGRTVCIVQDTVDAVTHAQVVLGRLDVDVRGRSVIA